MDQVQNRLSSGKKVSTPLDNPTTYFTSNAHLSRANALLSRKNQINEAIQTVKTASAAIVSIIDLFNSARNVASTAKTEDTSSAKIDLARQFNQILNQADTVVSEATYKGVSLLSSEFEELSVLFNESGSSSLTIRGINGKVVDLGLDAVNTDTATITYGDSENITSDGQTFTFTLSNVPLAGGEGTLVLQARGDYTIDKFIDEHITWDINGISSGDAGPQNGTVINEYKKHDVEWTQTITVSQDDLYRATQEESLTITLQNSAGVDFSGKNPEYVSWTLSYDKKFGWSNDEDIDNSITQLETAKGKLQLHNKKLSSGLNTLLNRIDFLDEMVNILKQGSANLVNADLEEEKANLLMLEVRQDLTTTALGISSSSSQNLQNIFDSGNSGSSLGNSSKSSLIAVL